MSLTPNLKLPFILAAQAQKHVTHNEAIRALDTIVQLAVLDRHLAAPPASPAEGDRYIVAAGASGDWAGHSGSVAARQDSAWLFYMPEPGWIAWVADESAAMVWNGTTWTSIGGGGGGGASLNPATGGLVGVNATADATNRLAVASAASLFNHEGAGHQQKINKATAADTASQLYQTGFSSRAEIGLTGDDDFHLKVSAGGLGFVEAMLVDKDTGIVTFPQNGATVVRRVYTAGATWTKPVALNFLGVDATVVAGGGGGGGASGVASQVAVGAGGGGGGAAQEWIPAASLGATVAVTVGAGGAAGANTGGNGGAGGSSSFGAFCSATGGSGGQGMVSGTSTLGADGGAGGAGSGGNLNHDGGGGSASLRLSGTVGISGAGGSSIVGGGGLGRRGSAVGNSGGSFGGGGGGGSSTTATAQAGGAGGAGVVIVLEYYQ